MIYVSLTTIPPRLKNLDKSIESLLNQTQKPDKIFINIPSTYKRFSETIKNLVRLICSSGAFSSHLQNLWYSMERPTPKLSQAFLEMR